MTYCDKVQKIILQFDLYAAKQLGMFGPTEIMYSFDTLQFNDYSRYDAEGINGDHKKQWHDTHFADDLNQAYNLGKRLVEECR